MRLVPAAMLMCFFSVKTFGRGWSVHTGVLCVFCAYTCVYVCVLCIHVCVFCTYVCVLCIHVYEFYAYMCAYM